MTNPGKVFGAALGSALLAWLLGTLLLWIGFYAAFPNEPEVLGIIAVYAMSSLPVCLIASLTIGVAWHVEALRRGLKRKIHYCLVGAACGAVLGPILVLLTWGWSGWPHAAVSFLYGSAMGGLTGLYAWLILRPDRKAPNPPTSTP